MISFDAKDLLAIATERTGLTDFGPEDFREGFNVLAEGLSRSTLIRDDRRGRLQERLLNMLINRLWFAKDLAEHPEIEGEVIAPPAIILSLPRTGSTKLQRVMAATGDFQALRLWSVMHFARIPGLPGGGVEERLRKTREYEKWMYEVSPEIAKWHPMHTEEAEEDCFLLESTFREMLNYGLTAAPGFVEWLDQTDPQPAFDWFISAIKYLQWQEPAGRHRPWLFKNPYHLGSEDLLARIYDKPRFIVTHRDPVKCMPSLSHTMQAARKMYLNSETSAELSAIMVKACADQTVRHMAWRDANPDAQVLDLAFREVTQDGIGTLRKIHDFLGMEFTASSLAGAQAWEDRNPRDKHGRTSYSAEEIGSSADDIRAQFAPYIQQFANYL